MGIDMQATMAGIGASKGKILMLGMLLSIASINLCAQKIGIRGGLNSANFHATGVPEGGKIDFISGANLALTSEFPLSNRFSIESGLYFNTKGGMVRQTVDARPLIEYLSEDYTGDTFLHSKAITKLVYLDVPLTGKINYSLGRMRVHGLFGPYVGVGLFGKSKNQVTYAEELEEFFSAEANGKWNSKEVSWGLTAGEDIRRLDYGILLGAGVELNGFTMRLTYSRGMANYMNTNSYENDGARASHRVFGVSLGYLFGSKTK